MAYTTIDDPTIYFNTVLYTGNGGSQNITGVGFSPDWVWLKGRNNANNNNLNDTVRGVNKQLYSDLTNAETTATTHLTAFDSDGFTLGNDGAVNGSSDTYVSWNWKAGGSASSNSNGSITSSVSANTTAGFSIVSYTGTGSAGATVGHGLGSVPQMLILKGRDQVENWTVYHEGLTSNNYALRLNDSAAQFSQTLSWNDTTPTSSVFTLGGGAGTSDYTNRSGISMIAYCFAEKKGYSKFGSYTGNGNADGTFVFTGFKPSMVIYKKSSGTENWFIHDNKRQGFNPDNELLFPDLSNAEGTVNRIDLLSNGFKATTSDGGINGSGATYIYMAFAESPFVNSNGVPNNAR
jgi:hypothetical protein